MAIKNLTLALLLSALVACGTPTATPYDPKDAKASAPADYKLPATGVLGITDLTNFAKQKRDFVKQDDFSKGFDDSPIAGRRFVVTLPLTQYSGSTLEGAEWTYDPDKEELTLTVVAQHMEVSEPSIRIQDKTEFGPKRKASNAFGAEFEVEPMETWSIEIGRNDSNHMGVFPLQEDLLGMGHTHGGLSFTAKLKPEQAKALVKGLSLRLEGIVERDEYKRTVFCQEKSSSATISSPTEWTRHICTLNVKLSRVAFVTTSGRVLKEWLHQPQPKKPVVQPLVDDEGNDLTGEGDAAYDHPTEAETLAADNPSDGTDEPIYDAPDETGE